MIANQLARNTYARPDPDLRDPRGLEYELLARATSALRKAAEGKGGFPELAAALDRNLRLWTALAADLASPGNALPEDLRARLFYLYEFTAAQSRQILEAL